VPQENPSTEQPLKVYNPALKVRGSLRIWQDKDMCWHGSASGKPGRSPHDLPLVTICDNFVLTKCYLYNQWQNPPVMRPKICTVLARTGNSAC
jgi:hypothetical protein